ncbi:MAG: hypothetical protein HYT10_01710 [Candidatus Levybacteria bacterium]|nr:hypothetical protein [Candidatus Levybacteria bacterium]
MRVYSEDIKNSVRLLRLGGLSLSQIQNKTNIPRTTIRDWLSATEMSFEHQEVIRIRVLEGLQRGRIEAQKIQRERRKELEKQMLIRGMEEIDKMNKRDFFIAGIALYWAEGFKNKHEHRLGFCNSDPLMIQFYINWLEKCLGVKKDSLVARLTLNKSYERKTREIEAYWSEITGIPLTQFTKPFYQNSIWKKQFDTDNYHGVLRIHVKDSLNFLLKMRGWIEGIKQNVLK